MAAKPIRVFWSELSERFYASAHYRDEGNGVVHITGKKFDVTNDIAQAIMNYEIVFTPYTESEGDGQ